LRFLFHISLASKKYGPRRAGPPYKTKEKWVLRKRSPLLKGEKTKAEEAILSGFIFDIMPLR